MKRLEVKQITRKECFEDLPGKARTLIFVKDTMPPLGEFFLPANLGVIGT
jgi:hypothetical protein